MRRNFRRPLRVEVAIASQPERWKVGLNPRRRECAGRRKSGFSINLTEASSTFGQFFGLTRQDANWYKAVGHVMPMFQRIFGRLKAQCGWDLRWDRA